MHGSKLKISENPEFSIILIGFIKQRSAFRRIKT
jgi:hypothetical protein